MPTISLSNPYNLTHVRARTFLSWEITAWLVEVVVVVVRCIGAGGA